ncbi:PAS domain-containing sensor histidine kinase, partial [Vibrio vulnificus]
MKKRVVVLIAIVMWLFVSQWMGKELVRQWQTSRSVVDAQQHFLDYIGDVRRALQRFYHLPYLLTSNNHSERFLNGERSLYSELRRELTLLDKAANTKGWYLLSASGDVLVSSLENEALSEQDLDAIVEQIHAQGEGVALVSKAKGASPFFYL